MSEGYAKAKEIAGKIKLDMEEQQELVAEQREQAISQLAVLAGNKDLAQMYQDSAQVGAANLAGELPQLKVHSVGKSTNELADGSEPADGWFYYKPTQEQFETVSCHILTISRGFRAEGMPDKNGKTESKFNQIVGGIIGMDKPFLMYFTGLKLQNLWDFGKAASKYTHSKPVAIPMFALTIKLSAEKIKNSFGNSWVVKFAIENNPDGSPVLVMDPGEFIFLKDNAITVEETIAKLIEAKAIRTDEDAIAIPVKAVNPADDIPFD